MDGWMDVGRIDATTIMQCMSTWMDGWMDYTIGAAVVIHTYIYDRNNAYIHTYMHTYKHTYIHTYIHTYEQT